MEREAQIEGFALQQQELQDELVALVKSVTSKDAATDKTSEEVRQFCVNLTHYLLTISILYPEHSKSNFVEQAQKFSDTYAEAPIADISRLKTDLGQLYVQVLNRIERYEKALPPHLKKTAAIAKTQHQQPSKRT